MDGMQGQRLPDEPAAPQAESPEEKALKADIADLVPSLCKTDSSPQLTALLRIVARARAMGAEGFKQMEALAKTLQKMRAFDDLYILTSEMNAHGMSNAKIKRMEIQALIELEVYETALDLVRPLLAKGVEDYDAREAYGNLGRIYKQMYVDARRDNEEVAKDEAKAKAAGKKLTDKAVLTLYLQRAFNAYMHVWELRKDSHTIWHGVNAVAIADMAVRHKVVEADPELDGLARAVLAKADEVLANKTGDAWTNATRGEALIALKEYEKAAEAYAAYADDPQVDAFALAGSLRQLEQLWELKGGEEKRGLPVLLLKTALLHKAKQLAEPEKKGANPQLQAVQVSISREERKAFKKELGPEEPQGDTGASRHALQKVLGKEQAKKARVVRKLLERSDAACRIHEPQDGSDRPMASGFAIKGSLLYAAWGDKPVIVTNNHVISSGGGGGSRFEVCSAIFVSEDEKQDRVAFEDILWESEIAAHDVTVLSIRGELPAGVTPLTQLHPVGLGKRLCEHQPPEVKKETEQTPEEAEAEAARRKKAEEEPEGIGMCYIVGYPDAGDLSISLSDNILLDHDAPPGCDVLQQDGHRKCTNVPARPVRIHYRTPTSPGSSGSAVLDSKDFALLAVHHAGSQKFQKLKPNQGIYAANEGIWIDSIRAAIAETLASGGKAWRAGPDAMPKDLTQESAPESLPEPDRNEAARATAPAKALIRPGSPGDAYPGVSMTAEQLLHPPRPATAAELARASLETVTNGVDSRTRIFDTRMAPWRMIVAIRGTWGPEMKVGTGVFIGPNTILTAGHVVFPQGKNTLPSELEIIPGLNDADRPYGTLKSRNVSLHPRWKLKWEIEHDVAVIHLNEPAGHKVGWFGVASKPQLDLQQRWAHVTGYPGEMVTEQPPGADGKPQPPLRAMQLWHHASPVDRVEYGRIFYMADTTAGQSGAPIYVLPDEKTRSTPLVVGVHAYGVNQSANASANSGAWIDADMFQLIQNWLETSKKFL